MRYLNRTTRALLTAPKFALDRVRDLAYTTSLTVRPVRLEA